MQSLLSKLLPLLLFIGALEARYSSTAVKSGLPNCVSRTIVVDKSGLGNFTSVQQAIDSIPSNNLLWTRILISSGTYIEKVEIPREKPYIILEGNPNGLTTIEYGDAGNVVESPTFKLQADNFIARHVTFKNTYNTLLEMDDEVRNVTWAPAAAIAGDKASFYQCGFISLQDTLSDARGRHYFYDSYVEGAIDFIWGNGQSMYEKCQINSTTSRIGRAGFITAQGRESANETTGFVFKHCYVSGSGPIFLGRSYRNYSRVLFAGTYMEDIITPEGWNLPSWSVGSEDLITFSEANCSGPGANMSYRVKWEKQLSHQELMHLTNTTDFINQEGWIDEQPN
uniref:probable pectinesterase 29 n=1 Tax=Fragaria vesca subsp. vesca TaxID=101020 RepID=UPI0005CA5E78|nr:PREDICTED: probable pectinesterase 29 [Fragaria vesca subsp. vesca]